MAWEYITVIARTFIFPDRHEGKWRFHANFPGEGSWAPFFIGHNKEDRKKQALWLNGSWADLELDPDVNWHNAARLERIIWSRWSKCFRPEVDGLDEYGTREWEVVTAYPDWIPTSRGDHTSDYKVPVDVVYLLKRSVPAPTDGEPGP